MSRPRAEPPATKAKPAPRRRVREPIERVYVFDRKLEKLLGVFEKPDWWYGIWLHGNPRDAARVVGVYDIPKNAIAIRAYDEEGARAAHWRKVEREKKKKRLARLAAKEAAGGGAPAKAGASKAKAAAGAAAKAAAAKRPGAKRAVERS